MKAHMLRTMMKAKIHNAAITAADLNYMGSITIDGVLMDEVDMMEHERVQIVNVNNGARFDTYTIRGEEGSGVVCLNGPAARMGCVGDRVHIIAYAAMDEAEARTHVPAVIVLGDGNSPVRRS